MRRKILSVTDLIPSDLNPAPFSPYFTLTYSWYVSEARRTLGDPPVPVPPVIRQPTHKPPAFTVKELYGRMRTMSDNGQAEFLLLLMKQVDVDWSAACKTAAELRSIRPASQVVDHLSRIAHKHALELQSGKKITGGLLLNKTLVAAPMANPAGAKGPEAAKLLRKRKRARLDKNAPVKKKKEATQGTNTAEDQDTEQLAADPSTAE